MSNDERPESLAAQAAAWVPPWERQRPQLDREFQARAEHEARGEESDDEDRSEAGLSDDDDDFDPAFEGANPPSHEEPEVAAVEALPGEGDGAVAVDAPQELPGEAEPGPTEVLAGDEVLPPGPVEEAVEEDDEDSAGAPVDAPMPADGAGNVGSAAGGTAVEGGVSVPAQVRGEDAEERRTEKVAMGDAELAGALESIMLVVDEPVAEMQLAQILEQPTERVAEMLDDLSARYTAAGHGFDLRRVAGGWRLYTRPEYADYVERFVLDGQSVRLTQAALETLAVVAYKQPVTRSRISAIRGVNCDGVMRTLATRGLIEECGTESETGAYLYRTTALFLEKLGLNSVDQLPPLAPFLPDDVEEVLDATG